MGWLHAEPTHGQARLADRISAHRDSVLRDPHSERLRRTRQDTRWEAALDIGLIALVAPFFRYLLGTQPLDSGGSILAIGLLHASFNAAGQLSAVPGGWQYIPAMIVLTLGVIGYRRLRGRSFSRGFAPALVAPTTMRVADEPVVDIRPAVKYGRSNTAVLARLGRQRLGAGVS